MVVMQMAEIPVPKEPVLLEPKNAKEDVNPVRKGLLPRKGALAPSVPLDHIRSNQEVA